MINMMNIEWPPLYQIKKSARVRHVQLKASAEHGLQLIVPLHFKPAYAAGILENHKSWIIKKLSELHASLHAQAQQPLPAEIVFSSIGHTWVIDYIATHHKKMRLVTRPHQELALCGDVTDKAVCKERLRLWVRKQAEIHLVKLLDEVSQETQLGYQQVIIRNQQSRWGSCSSNKTISLNVRLLFLPLHLVRYILIHELCHTVHMNHSRRFWALVSAFDPACDQHRYEMRRAGALIPTWF